MEKQNVTEQKIQTGLRISESVRERILEKAEDMGVSMNDAMLVLINIGLTVADNGFILPRLKE